MSRPARSRVDHVVGAGPVTAAPTAAVVVQPRQVAEADARAGEELEAVEVLERAGHRRPPRVGVDAAERLPSSSDLVRTSAAYILREQLDQGGLAGAVLADDRHHGARRAGAGRRRSSTACAVPG